MTALFRMHQLWIGSHQLWSIKPRSLATHSLLCCTRLHSAHRTICLACFCHRLNLLKRLPAKSSEFTRGEWFVKDVVNSLTNFSQAIHTLKESELLLLFVNNIQNFEVKSITQSQDNVSDANLSKTKIALWYSKGQI